MWVLIVLGALIAAMGVGIIATEPGRRELKEMTFPPELTGNPAEGTHVGEYRGTKGSFRNTKVQVTVSDGRVASIQVLEGSSIKDGKPIELRNGQSIDGLSPRVIKEQSLHVDVISGAALNSNAHLKAAENAPAQAGNH